MNTLCLKVPNIFLDKKMMTKLVLSSFLVLAVVLIGQFDCVSATGSKTYETNDGFPTNFLNDIVNSVSSIFKKIKKF